MLTIEKTLLSKNLKYNYILLIFDQQKINISFKTNVSNIIRNRFRNKKRSFCRFFRYFSGVQQCVTDIFATSKNEKKKLLPQEKNRGFEVLSW